MALALVEREELTLAADTLAAANTEIDSLRARLGGNSLKSPSPADMLDKIWANLEMVVRYGLPGIKDAIDRDSIVTAYGLVDALRKAQRS